MNLTLADAGWFVSCCYRNIMQDLIDKYELIPHPEGGFYREVYRSGQKVHSLKTDQRRDACTHIYFLLVDGQVSKFHRVLHDEVWNVYEGAPLRLVRYDGKEIREELLGPGCEQMAAVVEGGVYQAAESTGEYSFAGCTVAPGFEFEDFSFLSNDPDAREEMQTAHREYLRFL